MTLFRGHAECVRVGGKQIKGFDKFLYNTFSTVRPKCKCPLGRKGYYEVELLSANSYDQRWGLAAEHVAIGNGQGVGDDVASWGVDGFEQQKWHSANGVAFELPRDAVQGGRLAAMSRAGHEVRCNLGVKLAGEPFRCAPPSADFTAFAEFEEDDGDGAG